MRTQRIGRSRIQSECAITRRRLLAAFAPCLAAAACTDLAFRADRIDDQIDLEEFMRMSRVLTGFHDLRDDETGQAYLEMLLADPERAKQLAALWTTAAFGGSSPPATVDDLAARGVYARPELATLADTITRYWYTGAYDDPAEGETVATSIGALAWQTLGYRTEGPSTCGGAFGHWAEAPTVD